MSYDLDRTTKYKCPCGKGVILEKDYSNDWNQSHTNYFIDCEECGTGAGAYHIEEVGYTKPDGEYRTTPYLVPKGESLHFYNGGSYNLRDTPFNELLCMWYTKSDLEHAYEVLKVSTYYSRITDRLASSVCGRGKEVLKTVKPKIIREYVPKAIDMYDDVSNNYELNTIRVAKEKERVTKTKEKSICLYALEEIK